LSRAYSTLVKRVIFLSFLAVLVCAAPALALTWYLSNDVTLGNTERSDGSNGNGTLSGWFTVEPISTGSGEALTAWDIKANVTNVTIGSNPFSFTSTPANSTGSAFSVNAGEDALDLNSTSTSPYHWLSLVVYTNTTTYPSLDWLTPGVYEVVSNTGYWIEAIGGTPPALDYYGTIPSSGTVSSVPLPPSALLLGTGLIPLAWASRRKLWRK